MGPPGSAWEMRLQLLGMFITNTTLIPVMVILWRRRRMFDFACSVGGFLSSVVYHWADTTGSAAGFGPLRWHQIDNIFSHAGFVILAANFMQFKQLYWEELFKSLGLVIIVFAQVLDPWNIAFTFGPLGLMFAISAVKVWLTGMPKLHGPQVKAGVALMLVAGIGFVKGLDDENDYLRLWHGMCVHRACARVCVWCGAHDNRSSARVLSTNMVNAAMAL